MDRKTKKLLLVLLIAIVATSIVWFPAVVMAVTDNLDRFDYYVKALEYGLKGLWYYFKFIVELFKTAITT